MNEEEKKAIEELEEFIEDDEIQNISVFTAKKIKNIIEKQKEQIKSLKDENDFLRFMYKGTEEYKAVERYASGDHIPRID